MNYHAAMAIFLDDEAVELVGADLGAVLDAAKAHLKTSRRVVVDIHIDGQSLNEDQIDQARTQAVADSEIKLYSAHPGELAVQTLNGMRLRLGHAQAAQEEAAELLQSDKGGEALGKLSEAIDIWLQVQQAVLHSAMLLGVDLEHFAVDDEPVRGFTEELLAKLNEMKELIQGGDTVGMADALAYEWPELTEKWDRLLEELVRRIEENV